MTEEEKHKYELEREKRKSLTTEDRILKLEKLYKKLPKYIELLKKAQKTYARIDKLIDKHITTEVTEKGHITKNVKDIKLTKIEKINMELEYISEKLWKYSENLWNIHMLYTDEHDLASDKNMEIQDLVNNIYDYKLPDIEDLGFEDNLE